MTDEMVKIEANPNWKKILLLGFSNQDIFLFNSASILKFTSIIINVEMRMKNVGCR